MFVLKATSPAKVLVASVAEAVKNGADMEESAEKVLAVAVPVV